jgi:Polyketide cyclase / dehydrase and lipid transport
VSDSADRPPFALWREVIAMVEVQLSETIACRPEAWLALVLDVRRYATIDDKIGPIRWVRRDGDLVEFKFWPRLPGLSLPALPIVSQMRLTPGRRIDVQLAPLPRNITSRAASTFRASFSCEPDGEGVRVTRAIFMDFRPAVRWLVEPVLRRTLPESVARELRLAKQMLEGEG